VNYYRCDACGDVWTVSKDGKRLLSMVTVHHEPLDPNKPN